MACPSGGGSGGSGGGKQTYFTSKASKGIAGGSITLVNPTEYFIRDNSVLSKSKDFYFTKVSPAYGVKNDLGADIYVHQIQTGDFKGKWRAIEGISGTGISKARPTLALASKEGVKYMTANKEKLPTAMSRMITEGSVSPRYRINKPKK
jgi:hypothetical protein